MSTIVWISVKTYLIVMSTRQKRDTSAITITIVTPTATITPSSVERLLGAQVHQDMHWREHILDNKESRVASTDFSMGGQVPPQINRELLQGHKSLIENRELYLG